MMSKVKKEPESKQKSPQRKGTKKDKNTEESDGKYGYISPASINCMADSIGISGLSEAVTKSLAEDVSHRLRHVIQLCSMYLKMTRHKKLTTRDVDEVFKMCDIPSSVGSGYYEAPADFVNIKEASVFVKDDPVIDLYEYALAEVSVSPRQKIFVTGSWNTGDEFEVKTEEKPECSTDQDACKQSDHGNHVKTEPNASGRAVQSTSDENSQLSKNLIKYYSITCSTILGHSDLSMIYRDLATSSRIFEIVPYLLNFLTIALNRLTSERQIIRLLRTVEALVANKNIDVSSQWPAARIGKALLLLVAGLDSPLQLSHKGSLTRNRVSNYNMKMRRYAAMTTAKVLSNWCVREEEKWQIVPQVGKLLNGAQNASMKVLYGALHLIIALGPNAIHTALKFDKILGNLAYMPRNPDVQLFEDSILIAINVVMRYPECSDTSVIASDRAIYDYYGEALACRRFQPLIRGESYLNNQSNVSKINVQSNMKYFNISYNVTPVRTEVKDVFDLPEGTLAKRSQIAFKFGKVRAESTLKRRQFTAAATCDEQFISDRQSEANVVLVGRAAPRVPYKFSYLPSLFYVL